ncbi:MAG: trypsin-like peptidase domain-containing protein [bacterium]|nr:trypsin-like peptidase domain-containing protein [bacterium]
MNIVKRIALIFLVLILFSNTVLSAAIRESVAIIECKPNKQLVNALENIAKYFEKSGYRGTAKLLREHKKGWSGSGFVVRANGQNFLVSNKHVLGNSGSITIKFEDKKGNLFEIKEKSTVFEDSQLDLALLVLPEGIKNIEPLRLYDKEIIEGDDAYAAGYPDLLGQPSWQLTKGIVSNSFTKVPTIIDPEICRLVQHSASIDPGSSGGPLLVKNGNNKNWSVIGVSSYSITSRSNTFFAIPVTKVKELIKKYHTKKKNAKNKEAIRKEIELFVKDLYKQLKEPAWNASKEHRFVSIDKTAQKGWDSILRLFDEGDKEIIKKMNHRFQSLSFFDAMRESVSWSIWHIFQNQEIDKTQEFNYDIKSIPVSREEGSIIKVDLIMAQKSLKADLIFESGQWSIKEIQFSEKPKSKEAEIEMERSIGYQFHIGVGLAPSFENEQYSGNETLAGYGMLLALESGHYKYLSTTHGLYVGMYSFTSTYDSYGYSSGYGYSSYSQTTTKELWEIDYQFSIKLRFPIAFSWGYVIPFANAGVDLIFCLGAGAVESGTSVLYLPVKGGGGLGFLSRRGWGFGVNIWKRSNVIGDGKLDDIKTDIYFTIGSF